MSVVSVVILKHAATFPLSVMGLLSALLGSWATAADAGTPPAAAAGFCEAQFPQASQCTARLDAAATKLHNEVVMCCLVQMWHTFVDHVVDTAYTGSCISRADPEVSSKQDREVEVQATKKNSSYLSMTFSSSVSGKEDSVASTAGQSEVEVLPSRIAILIPALAKLHLPAAAAAAGLEVSELVVDSIRALGACGEFFTLELQTAENLSGIWDRWHGQQSSDGSLLQDTNCSYTSLLQSQLCSPLLNWRPLCCMVCPCNS